MNHINSYFNEHNLFDLPTLKDHCTRHSVRFNSSTRLPHLVILHYADECQWESKWNFFSRSCRGLVVDTKNKKLLTIPYSKFFNLGESTVPSFRELEALGQYEVSEKLDGSMLISFYDEVTNDFYVTTKGSLDSEHGDYFTKIFPPQLKSKELLTEYTLMFEGIDSKFQIVIDYEKKGYKPGLYLIGVRKNISQQPLNYAEVQEFAKKYNLPTVQTYTFSNLNEVVDTSKTLSFMNEGYVIRFKQNGLMVKIKGPEYLRVHRFISQLDEKNLLELLIQGQEKEVMTICPEEYRSEVEQTLTNFRIKALQLRDKCYEYFNQAPKDTRRDFALWVKTNAPGECQKFMFRLFDNEVLELQEFYKHFRYTKQYKTNPEIGFNKLVVKEEPEQTVPLIPKIYTEDLF